MHLIRLDLIGTEIKEREALLDRLRGQKQTLESLQREYQSKSDESLQKSDIFRQASEVLTSIVENHQTDLLKTVEGLVTEGLQSVFGSEYAFKIEQSRYRNQVGLSFSVVTNLDNGVVVSTGLLGHRGGGLLSVVGFILRLVLLMLFKDSHRLFLALDEVFANVSAEYVPTLVDFIKKISRELEVQILLVTHDPEFLTGADIAYRFELIDGITKIDEISKDSR